MYLITYHAITLLESRKTTFTINLFQVMEHPASHYRQQEIIKNTILNRN